MFIENSAAPACSFFLSAQRSPSTGPFAMRVDRAAVDQLKDVLGPYVSKYILRSNRKPYVDWRLDRAGMPAPIPFLPESLEGSKGAAPLFMGDCTVPVDLRRPYRILSLDGGGVRGIMITTMLERIVKKQPDFMQNVRSKFSEGAYIWLICSVRYTVICRLTLCVALLWAVLLP
jgi:hypothetical protein